MSPQATTTQDAQPATGSNQMAVDLVIAAQKLEGRRADLLEEVSANRTLLRLLDKNGQLENATVTVDGKQVSVPEWLDDFYPEKEKDTQRSKEEIAATQKVRAEARKRFAK